MNTPNLVAWLLCLTLGFFASAFALYNHGRLQLAETRLRQFSEQMQTQGEERDGGESALERLRAVRRLVGQARADLKAAMEEPEADRRLGHMESLDGKLQELEVETGELQRELGQGRERNSGDG